MRTFQWNSAGHNNDRDTPVTFMPRKSKPDPKLPPRPRGPELGERVGAHLRHIYDDVLLEPVPDQFEDLLRKLA